MKFEQKLSIFKEYLKFNQGCQGYSCEKCPIWLADGNQRTCGLVPNKSIVELQNSKKDISCGGKLVKYLIKRWLRKNDPDTILENAIHKVLIDEKN